MGSSSSSIIGDGTVEDKPIVPNWQKTSLRDYFEPFVRDFLEPLAKEVRREEKEAAEEQAALVGDF
jgi:hypothetical protein